MKNYTGEHFVFYSNTPCMENNLFLINTSDTRNHAKDYLLNDFLRSIWLTERRKSDFINDSIKWTDVPLTWKSYIATHFTGYTLCELRLEPILVSMTSNVSSMMSKSS